MSDFAQISSNAQDGTEGNPGSITIKDVGTLEATRGSTIDATTSNDSPGGDITINAENIQLTDGGKIVTATSRTGDAGDIKIDVTGDVIIDNANPSEEGNFTEPVLRQLIPETGIFANTGAESTGNGGNINLTVAENVILRNNSEISAGAFEEGNGGNINIDAQFIIAFPNQVDGDGNDIIANAVSGEGGNININTQSLLGLEEREAIDGNRTNDIDASSDFSVDGTVTINSLNSNPVQESRELPTKVVEAEQTISQICNSNREAAAQNSFTIKGKGGIPPAPDLPLDSQNIIIDDRNTNNLSSIPQPIETSQGKIQPARGIKVTESGEIILTPYRTDNSGNRLPEIKRNCI